MIEKIDHIGVAVKNLEANVKFYRETLGVPVGEIFTHGAMRGAFVNIGGVEFELLENNEPNSAIAKHIEKKGEGIQHVAFQVDHIEKEMETLKGKGLAFIDEKPRSGARDARIAFMHPKNTYGILMELVEPAKK
ncbi:MAG: methylmalonyl-CoA epimerase [Deltaproteobacteria bacterium]|jgi:methylmalonyl-CoA/ethylmalonyl-CoA epimerase|nr:methylmalonyl-CoA epimerase [Deltaproteobacteria bacterium]